MSADTPIVKMIAQMHHRGPDDQGSALFRNSGLEVALGSTRLSIIDLSAAGHQPMSEGRTRTGDRGPTDDRLPPSVCGHPLWIVYNGEIYNFRELKEELSAKPTGDRRPTTDDWEDVWKSESDTEVILKAYRNWGVDSLRKLRGMFALAIWDNHREELLLARDRFGIKPLYYYATDKLFVFASEIRTLLASGLVPRRLSAEGLASYLEFGAVESPLTIIRDVQSLLPGRCLSVKEDQGALRVEETNYVSADYEDAKSKEQRAKGEGHRGKGEGRRARGHGQRGEAVAVLREKLEDSVRHHLVSDVPVAAFLSGGIDSSALVALMSRVAPEPPRTFTVTFAEKGFSEESFARIVAQEFGTQHHEIFLSETALLKMLPDALAAMDQPTIDGINTYVISQAVSEAGVKVALSGLGGDELFAGYPSFRRVQRLRRLASVPASVRQAAARAGRALINDSVRQRKAWNLLAAGATPENAYAISRQLFSAEEIGELTDDRRLRTAGRSSVSGRPSSLDPINAVSILELTGYMANTLLRDTDHMSMAHSLEVRVPFVDSEVVSFVLGLRGDWKLDGSRPKPLLLDAVGELLPERIWRRRKMGFVLPFERWMHTVLRPEMQETLSDGDSLRSVGISERGRAIWQTFDRTPRRERWARPWALYVLKRWCELNDVEL